MRLVRRHRDRSREHALADGEVVKFGQWKGEVFLTFVGGLDWYSIKARPDEAEWLARRLLTAAEEARREVQG